MKNNPFKKEDKFSNKQNQNQNLSFKDSHQKNFKYDPTNNSFNKSNSKKNFDKTNSIIQPTPSIELHNTNLFPDLVPIKTITQTNLECKFKNILTNIPINTKSPNKHIIPQGCLEITRVLQKYVYEFGETTTFIKEEKEEELNYIMNNKIELMKKKWDKYENDYDNIHGEGFYANKFRLPYVYDQEYETASDEQNDNSDEYHSNNEYNDYTEYNE
jgi:hypothetical protein